MCSELTPRAPIPDTRIPQLMQPWCVCVEELVDGGIAVTLSLSLGLVLGRRVRVDALGVVVRLEDVLLCVSLVLSPGVSSNLLGLLESLLLEGWLLVGRLDRLLRCRLVVGLLPPGLLLLVGRGRPLLLNLLEVLEPALLP